MCRSCGPPPTQASLACDPADRAPGQQEPGSEDEADDCELRRGARALAKGRRQRQGIARPLRVTGGQAVLRLPICQACSLVSWSNLFPRRPLRPAVVKEVRQELEEGGSGGGAAD